MDQRHHVEGHISTDRMRFFYTYKDADGLLWYSNADDDGDYFSDAVQILTMAKATQIANWQLKQFAKKMIHIWMCSQRAKMQ